MKSNLLIIVPTLHLGGQERVAVNTAEIMSEEYEITFVVFDGQNAVYMPSCEIIDLDIPAMPGKLKKIFNVFRRASALRKIKKDKNIDYSLSFGTTANLVNVLSRHKGKTIINLRGFESISDKAIDRFIYNHSDTIICCAQDMCRALLRINTHYKKKTTFLYNPYDLKHLLNKGREAVSDYIFTSQTIVTQGRLEEVKNYPRLIKAFSLVRKQVANAQLLIIGEGTQRPQLKALISLYHLEDSVTLLGFRKNPYAYLEKSALYVLSSYSEGFPNSLVEGMVFLPVIAVDCKTGPREILSNNVVDYVDEGWKEEEYGILVKPAAKREFSSDLTEDDRILAEAMLSVLLSPEKAKEIKSKAYNRVKSFSYEAYQENLQKILEIEK